MNFLDPRLPDRFWSKVQPCPMSGCWLWTGSTRDNGYGCFESDGRQYKAHRFVMAVNMGVRDFADTIDHRCEIKCCVNPAHLDIVSIRENTLRYWDRRGFARKAAEVSP